MAEIKVVHHDQLELEAVSGAMKRWSGVSENLTKAEGLHMGMSTIPVGCASSPHHHTNCESAIYVIQGHGKMLLGNHLDKALEFGPGDFIYVPPFAPHQPVNCSDSEEVVLIIARNSPVELVEEYLHPGEKTTASPSCGGTHSLE